MNDPRAAQLLRKIQIDFQCVLNHYLNDTGTTPEQVAERAGVSDVIVKRMAAGTYSGMLSYLIAVSLAIGRAPVFEQVSTTPTPPESA